MVCVVCGLSVQFIWRSEKTNASVHPATDFEGAFSGVRRPALHMSAAELEKKQLKRTEWRAFYRMFIYDQSKKQYKLSGIGQPFEGAYYCFPLDPERAVVGIPAKKTESGLVRLNHALVNWWYFCAFYQRGWEELVIQIHMRCWVYVQEVIGPKIHEHLGLFLAVSLTHVPDLSLSWAERSQTQDPSVLPGYKLLLRQGKLRKKREHLTTDCDSQNPPAISWLSHLPCEILYLIFDLLDHSDCTAVQSVIHIPIGDTYWRRRVTLLLTGMDKIDDESKVDWRHLCLGLERLHASPLIAGSSSRRFEFRCELLAALEKLKIAFFRQLKMDNPLQIEDVVRKMYDERLANPPSN